MAKAWSDRDRTLALVAAIVVALIAYRAGLQLVDRFQRFAVLEPYAPRDVSVELSRCALAVEAELPESGWGIDEGAVRWPTGVATGCDPLRVVPEKPELLRRLEGAFDCEFPVGPEHVVYEVRATGDAARGELELRAAARMGCDGLYAQFSEQVSWVTDTRVVIERVSLGREHVARPLE